MKKILNYLALVAILGGLYAGYKGYFLGFIVVMISALFFGLPALRSRKIGEKND